MQILIWNKWNSLNTFPRQFYQGFDQWVMQKKNKENTIVHSNRLNSNVARFVLFWRCGSCEGRNCVTHIEFCGNSRKFSFSRAIVRGTPYSISIALIRTNVTAHAKAMKSIKQCTLNMHFLSWPFDTNNSGSQPVSNSFRLFGLFDHGTPTWCSLNFTENLFHFLAMNKQRILWFKNFDMVKLIATSIAGVSLFIG